MKQGINKIIDRRGYGYFTNVVLYNNVVIAGNPAKVIKHRHS